jgi:hypothetical protein
MDETRNETSRLKSGVRWVVRGLVYCVLCVLCAARRRLDHNNPSPPHPQLDAGWHESDGFRNGIKSVD